MKPTRDPHAETKQALHTLGVTPSKRRGQNFLQNPAIADQIASFAEIRPGETVVEIGAGLGALTEMLLPYAANLWIVEIERELCTHLEKRFPEIPADRIVCADVRQQPLSTLLPAASGKCVVVSNVPYSISSELTLWLFENRRQISRASLLLQREFAERLAAEPGSRAYGSLTVMRKCYAEAHLGAIVPGSEFFPPAEVDSRLVELRFYDEDLQKDIAPELFEHVVRAAFSQKRKTLLNCLTGAKLFSTKAETAEFLSKLGIDPGCRAEALEVDDFLRIATEFSRRS